jgi:hypothetical protein
MKDRNDSFAMHGSVGGGLWIYIFNTDFNGMSSRTTLGWPAKCFNALLNIRVSQNTGNTSCQLNIASERRLK